MEGLFDYLHWRGDIPFSQVSPTPVDALIFSALSYIGFDGIVPKDLSGSIPLDTAAEQFAALPDAEKRVRVRYDQRLLEAAAKTLRFRSCKLCFFRNIFVPEEDTQFAAVTFLLEDGSAFLAFRGTDYSVAGWKEDFNMSFLDSVPAQREALAYTREFASHIPVLLRLGGHSKGGNLAVYAAAKNDPTIQKRIMDIYSLDGPGFTEAMMNDPGYLRMVPKIHTYIPQSSIIGMLLEHQEPYSVIKSSLPGMLQHEFYSWNVAGGDFIHMEEISESNRFLDQTIKNWIADMSNEERSDFVETVFDLLGAGGAEQLSDILQPQNLRALIRTLGTDDKKRRLLGAEMIEFIKAAYAARQQLNS